MQKNLESMSQKDDAFEYVLDQIARSAVRRLGLEAEDPRYVFLLSRMLISLCGPNEDGYIASQMMNYLAQEGYDLPEEEVNRLVPAARKQCDRHVFALQTAFNDIESFDLSGEEAFSNISKFIEK